ncbi:MAG TPA: hypothetical protein VFB33_01625 [Candidatus Binataceae bacterium]|jgi:hypothetical protein|nr:hypothetical protein [Candidatus Binataceae bacterium]
MREVRSLAPVGGFVAGAAGVLLPAVAAACPVCYGASDPQVLSAYYTATIALLLLPLLLVGGFALWISRASRRAAAREIGAARSGVNEA